MAPPHSTKLTVLCVLLSASFLASCGGSSSGPDVSVLDDIADIDNGSAESDDVPEVVDLPDVTQGSNNDLDITYVTLDSLPPLQDRLYGGRSILAPVTGDEVGTGEYLNSDLVIDIPFTIEGETTRGLVIEQLYATRHYDRRPFSIDDELFADGPQFRLDLPEPRIYGVITNLSSVDMCNVNTARSFGVGGGLTATTINGDLVRANIPLIGSGVSYTVTGRDLSQTCISPGGSIFVYSEFSSDRFSELNEGDNFADIEDIESISLTELYGLPETPIGLEKGIVTIGYTPSTSRASSLSTEETLDGFFDMTVVNQSDKRLEHTASFGFVLDPITLLPVAHFSIDGLENTEDPMGDFNPGAETTGQTSNGGGRLALDSFGGSSNVLLFVNSFMPTEE